MFRDMSREVVQFSRAGEGPGPDGMMRLDQHGRWFKGWRYNPEWSYGRNGGTGVDGEWRPVNSWTAERWVVTSADEGTAIRLKVSISGDRGKNGRCRPHTWGASVHLGQTYIFTGNGPCKSVKEAMRKADAALEDWHIEKVRELAYFRPFSMKCIFRKEEDGTFKPFATNLAVDAHDSKNWYPLGLGDFIVARRDCKKNDDGSYRADWSTHRTFTMGMSGQFSQTPPPESEGLVPWFPPDPEDHDG